MPINDSDRLPKKGYAELTFAFKQWSGSNKDSGKMGLNHNMPLIS